MSDSSAIREGQNPTIEEQLVNHPELLELIKGLKRGTKNNNDITLQNILDYYFATNQSMLYPLYDGPNYITFRHGQYSSPLELEKLGKKMAIDHIKNTKTPIFTSKFTELGSDNRYILLLDPTNSQTLVFCDKFNHTGLYSFLYLENIFHFYGIEGISNIVNNILSLKKGFELGIKVLDDTIPKIIGGGRIKKDNRGDYVFLSNSLSDYIGMSGMLYIKDTDQLKTKKIFQEAFPNEYFRVDFRVNPELNDLP